MQRDKEHLYMDALIEDTEAQDDSAGGPPERRGDGRINGRYELKGELGSGGFATVYLAWDENLQRDVAVKIMRPELLQAEHRERFLQRFEREALLVARLDHNHLAPVYETGVFNHEGKDSAYIVMKYLEGMDLNDLLHKETLPIERTLLIMNQTLEALAYIHSQGVVHKDLKPSNIFLSQDHLGRDHVYLMDFGIAHDTQDERGRLTNTGMLAGTFQYMPPEYILQNMATPSVDVFQMGLIILEALTGSPLIHRSVTLPALVAHYLRQDPLDLPPPIAQSRAGQVIARAIEIDVDRRYADAGELLLAFSELTVDDFPSITPTLRDEAERHSEDLLSNPGRPKPTRETQPNIPSVREEDDQPTRRDTPPPALLPPPSSATALSASSDGRGNTALIAVGLIVAVAILGAVFALLTLRDPAPPTDAAASGTPTVAEPAATAAATPAPEVAPPEAKPPETEPATPPPSEVPPPPTTDAPAEAAAAPAPEVEEPEDAPEEAPRKKARKPRRKPAASKTPPAEEAPPVEKKPPAEEPPKKVKKPATTLPPEL